jgi:hypothetical protein
MRRRTVATAAFSAALLVVPAAAQAAAVYVDVFANQVSFVGDAGANYLGVSEDDRQFTFTQWGGTVSAGLGCEQVSSTEATCPAAPGRRLVIYGEGGDDTIHVGSYQLVYSGAGDDRVTSGRGTTVFGGDGSDTLEATRAFGEAGDDRLSGTDGDDELSGGDGNDSLRGGYGSDALSGEAGNDQLYGGVGPTEVDYGPVPGQDIPTDVDYDPVPDRDSLRGGPGIDDALYLDHLGGVRITLDGVANDGQQAHAGPRGQPAEYDNVHPDVENVTGSAYNDSLIGSSLAN